MSSTFFPLPELAAPDPNPAIARLSRLVPAEPRPRGRALGAAGVIVALTALAAVTGARANDRRSKVWYRLLAKSRATPPSVAFAVVWPVLYALSAASAWRVWKSPPSRARSLALGLWGAQLAANAAWSPIFFRARRPRLALADVGGLAGALASYALTAREVDRPAALLTLPYLGWVAFASYLNAAIVAKNRGPLRRALVD